MKIIKYILLPAILLVLFFPSRSLALSYNPNYLISDTDYTNSSSMNTDQIQRFLQSKGSVLANMRVRVEGVLKSVAGTTTEEQGLGVALGIMVGAVLTIIVVGILVRWTGLIHWIELMH